MIKENKKILDIRRVELLSDYFNDFSFDSLLNELKDPRIVNHIRGLLLKLKSENEVKKMQTKIDQVISNGLDVLPDSLDLIFFANISYLSPTYFWRNISYFSIFFKDYNYRASILLLQQEGSLKKLTQFLENKNVSLSPVLILCMAFKLCLETELDELFYLNNFLSRLDGSHYSHLVKNALLRRIKGIKANDLIKDHSHVDKIDRVALFICGQFRALEVVLPQLAEMYDLENMDVYVSSWKQQGYSKLDRSRILRRFDSSTAEYINNFISDSQLQEINTYEKNFSAEHDSKNEEIILKYLGKSKNLYVSLLDENEVVYRDMHNHQKMHFHNSYWIKKLGKDFFIENYDLLIKTRPDLELSEKRINISNFPKGRFIKVDYPRWLFELWGFGMGDQFFYGRSELMVELLDISYPKSLSTRLLSELFGFTTLYQGHINLGIELWLLGGKPIASDFNKKGFFSEKKMNLDQFLELAFKSGLNIR